jgi:hypothetical protein
MQRRNSIFHSARRGSRLKVEMEMVQETTVMLEVRRLKASD